jgi:hypothetical protein
VGSRVAANASARIQQLLPRLALGGGKREGEEGGVRRAHGVLALPLQLFAPLPYRYIREMQNNLFEGRLPASLGSMLYVTRVCVC